MGYDTKGAAPPPAPPNVAPYPGQSQPHATTVNVAVMSPNAYGVNRSLGSYSAQVNCQHCHAYVSLITSYWMDQLDLIYSIDVKRSSDVTNPQFI